MLGETVWRRRYFNKLPAIMFFDLNWDKHHVCLHFLFIRIEVFLSEWKYDNYFVPLIVGPRVRGIEKNDKFFLEDIRSCNKEMNIVTGLVCTRGNFSCVCAVRCQSPDIWYVCFRVMFHL